MEGYWRQVLDQFRNDIELFASGVVKSFRLVSPDVSDQSRTGIQFKIFDTTINPRIPVFATEAGKIESVEKFVTRDYYSGEKGERLASRPGEKTSGESADPDLGMYEGSVASADGRYVIATSGWKADEDAAHGLVFLEVVGMISHDQAVAVAESRRNGFYLERYKNYSIECIA